MKRFEGEDDSNG